MARAAAAPRRSRRGLIPIVAGLASIAVVATLAVVVDGYDAQEVPAVESSVWVTRSAGQYARVNTELGEIDTVRTAADPSGIAQNGSAGLVFTQGFGRAWTIDPANPGNLGGSSTEAGNDGSAADAGEPTPTGTRAVGQSGTWLSYLTDTGKAYLGQVPIDGKPVLPFLIDPFRDVKIAEGAQGPSYVASAITVDQSGLVAMYSAAESAVRVYDAARDAFQDPVEVPSPPASDAKLSIALVHGGWALFDSVSGLLWLPGRADPVDTGLSGAAVLQTSTTTGAGIHLADDRTLIAVDPSTGERQDVATGSGTPAQPTIVAGELVAAWLSSSAGSLWTESAGSTPLTLDGKVLDEVDAIVPVIRSNGDRAVLNETSSGMLWSIPDGTLIPVAEWNLDDQNDRASGTIQVDDVAEQQPPVAVDDSFGVRSGELVALPVLLNDHDPNKKDVLTIVPESIRGGDGFGTISLAANDQEAVVRVTAGSGSSTFSYSVTDGVSTSPPASVTLTVVGDSNTAPEWCGVDACVQDWPTPGISAGGTVTVPVLFGWVDHEGDAFVLSDAVKDDPSDPVTVVATADGNVVVRHQDPNAGDDVIPITVTVTDSRGATATKTLEVRVTANSALVAEPIAAVAGVNEKVSVDVAQYVRGGSGSFSIVDAVQTSQAGGLIVVPNAAAGTIDLTASTVGDYVITYTVQDLQTSAQQSAILRVTVVGGGAPLSMAPITAFVRANEDTTVDVLAAVQNTSGRVLIVSEATSSQPNLGVSVVGQSRIRVSGSTANGLPGTVGTALVTVTDGAGDSVQGSVTVFLVASATVTGPIAVPDTATVRAGNQADILVLANDVSPRGERVVLHPDLTGSGTAGELAFVAGDRVRYLAPQAPGVYTLRYSLYLENAPQLLDSATITVTVLPAGTNRAPQPPILTGRVVAGQSISIPFSGSGIDPDGDRVVLSDVEQPAAGQGFAAISAEGDAITYTAPGNGVSGGQVSFAYRVRDTAGEDAEGVVRIGVLSANLTDLNPITYGDYLRVQAGTPTPLTVSPLLNDRDPKQGQLVLQKVVPNAVKGTPEYDRLLALLDTSKLTSGEISVSAGDVLGVHSYVYTVVSQASFSVGQGLIVVNVTDTPSPDAPLVTDTVVTAENRSQLESGIDVVTGKVQWATGDPAGLELAIWGPSASRYTVSGSRIAGDLPADGDIVPFSLTGIGSGGGTVVSYGFLRIPAFDDMRLQLRPGTAPVPVPEEQSVAITVRDLLDLDPSDRIEIRNDPAYSVQRANASCTHTSSTAVTYTAGREAPWADACTVPVRVVGQDTWTLLGIPVIIQPKDPQAILNSISMTVPPGGTSSVSFYQDMTKWEGDRVGDLSKLDYQTAFTGTAFVVTPQSDGSIKIDADARATSGTRETVRVSVTGYGGLTAGITLIVGIAPADAPRGASFTQQCDVSQGATCSIAVIGRAGEYDPFKGALQGSGLTLVGVGSSATGGTVTCPVASVRVGDDHQVIATWPSGPKPTGGECVVPFTVADAQGRTGPGQLTIDVLGYPQRPASVTTTAYTSSSVTLRVDLGDARTAHPPVTDVRLYEGGSPTDAATCSPNGADYTCIVTGLVNGADHTYTARAVNSVGESLDTNGVVTRAYAKPVITNLAVDSVYRPGSGSGSTGPNTGIVSLSITAGDDAQAYRVLVSGTPVTTISRTGNTTTADISLQPGSRLLQVIPISRFTPPISGSNEGDTVSISALAVGIPLVTANGTASSTSDGTGITLAGADAGPNGSPDAMSVTYYAWQGAQPSCTADANGDQQVSGAAATSTTSTISGLTANEDYSVSACISYGFGAVSTGAVAGYTFAAPAAPAGPLTYRIATSPSSRGDTMYYGLGGVDRAANNPGGFQERYRVNGGPLQGSLTDLPSNATPTVTVAFCKTIGGQPRCSAETVITPAAGGPSTTITLTFPQCRQLNPDDDAGNAALITASGPADRQFSPTSSNTGNGRFYQFDVQWTGSGYTGLLDANFQRLC